MLRLHCDDKWTKCCDFCRPKFLPLRGGEWWRLPESNWGHMDFQSIALPTELKRRPAKVSVFSICDRTFSQGGLGAFLV
jgi:hypothetical protein